MYIPIYRYYIPYTYVYIGIYMNSLRDIQIINTTTILIHNPDEIQLLIRGVEAPRGLSLSPHDQQQRAACIAQLI
jgi:hypothetical protein